MTEFGFIGLGSMGRMLISGLIRYAKVPAANIAVTRRDRSRLAEIGEAFPGVQTRERAAEIASAARSVFLCVKPAEVKAVLQEIGPVIGPNAQLISLAGTVPLDMISRLVNCRVSKLMPTIVSEIGEGIQLICHGPKVTEGDKEALYPFLEKLGKIKPVNERDFGFASELTSCNPGLIASILRHMAGAAAAHTKSFTPEEINEMITHTAYATTKLLLDKEMTYAELIGRVATKGGITQEGVAVFDERLPEVFDAMFEKMLIKRSSVEERIRGDFIAGEGTQASMSIGDLAIDCAKPERLRGFYAELTGWEEGELYGCPALIAEGGLKILFMGCDFDHIPPVWPERPGEQQKQLHFDLQAGDLPAAVERALRLGARKPAEQYGGEEWVTLLDPEGHPFCLTGKGTPARMSICDLSIDCREYEKLCDFYAALTGWNRHATYGSVALIADCGLVVHFMGCDF
ncbi:MAG: NAD(P)-binding domain-containing protein, partial [Christensenellaceae bacterium]|nr:NAD(P)-binding domain-containing protein [Christensenellaceae bacterium]